MLPTSRGWRSRPLLGADRDFLRPGPAARAATFRLGRPKASWTSASLAAGRSSLEREGCDRGVRKLLQRYATAAGLTHPISPHGLRHFLLTWLKKQRIDDALIQPYSGHASRQSLEIYSRLAIGEAREAYETVMHRFPV